MVRCIEIVEKLITTLKGEDQKRGAAIVKHALSAPLRQIVDNAGISGEVVLEKLLENKSPSYGFDAHAGVFCDMYETGIIDPTKVVKAAIQNAASVAGLVLTTDVLLVEPKKLEE